MQAKSQCRVGGSEAARSGLGRGGARASLPQAAPRSSCGVSRHPASLSEAARRRGERGVCRVIPMLQARAASTATACLVVLTPPQGDASQQLPPDLPSFLFKERIVYLVRARAVATLLGVAP